MIQAYADGALVYDSRLATQGLLGLTYTGGLNKAGTASLVLPPEHPRYEDFISYRTVVEIYRDSVLVFRGRVLYPADDFYKRRTITCEGERGFFRDAVMRPYIYQDSPAAIFADVINLYNAQMEAFKQFVVGEVTVIDANNSIRLESTKAEQIADTIDKLVERCGGYIVFTTNTEGQRVVNWYAELSYRSSQTIEFGKNLTNFARSDISDDLATIIVPYGAQIEETGKDGESIGARVTIESVNDGRDFLQDDDAVAIRGVIAKPVYWDDVTEPANLLEKAQAYLADSRNIITGLDLTTVDLSALDKNIDSFRVGDIVHVRSKPHNVDDDFLLTEMTVDLLDPAGSSVTLGKEKSSLTGMDVAGDRKSSSELHQIEHDIRADYKLNITAAEEETRNKFLEIENYIHVEGVMFSLGEAMEEIPSEADLNDYVLLGVYACRTNEIAKTLYNRPTDIGFTMRVYSGVGNKYTESEFWYVIQEIQPYQAAEPTKRRTLTRDPSGVWTAGGWFENPVASVTTINAK